MAGLQGQFSLLGFLANGGAPDGLAVYRRDPPLGGFPEPLCPFDENVSRDGIPLGSSMKVSNHSILALPKVSISPRLPAPAMTAHTATGMMSPSGSP